MGVACPQHVVPTLVNPKGEEALHDDRDEDEEFPSDKDERAKLIETMLCAVEDELSDGSRTNEFIESLRDQFDRKGFMTDSQMRGLQKFYRRAT